MIKQKYMANSGTFKTSISLPVDLWNNIQDVIEQDEMSFSRFVQSASRLKLKQLKMQNVRDFLDSLGDDEMNILQIEIKKRG